MPVQPGNRPVVVGIDGSASSLDAAAWAAREAERHGVRLHVVTAFGWPEEWVVDGPAARKQTREGFLATARTRLTTAVEAARAAVPDLEVSEALVQERPIQALADAGVHARLLVVGHRGLGGLAGLVLGSVAAALVVHAECPVVVVRSDDGVDGAGRPVVVGVDGSPAGEAALAFAFDAAATRGVTLSAVHAWQIPVAAPMIASAHAEVVAEESEVLAERLAGWSEKYPEVSVERVLLHGGAGRILVEQSEHAQLLVVGSRGRGGATSLLLGSVGHGVVHRSHCPVAVVRPETTATV